MDDRIISSREFTNYSTIRVHASDQSIINQYFFIDIMIKTDQSLQATDKVRDALADVYLSFGQQMHALPLNAAVLHLDGPVRVFFEFVLGLQRGILH